MKNKISFLITILILWITSLNIANAQNCIQCDENCNPSGTYSSVMGMSSTATSDMALAGGFNSHAYGAFSFAYGNQVLTNGANSFAFGRFVEATATSAIIFGSGYDLNNKLTNNTTSSFMIGFNSDVPTFLVKGNGGLNRTGRIGIGNVTDPQAKLHIREDENIDEPGVFIQGFNEEQPAYLWLGTKSYGVRRVSRTLEFLTGDYYEFNDGNVGIGISEPREKLEIDGNVKVMESYRLETAQVRSNSREGLKMFTSMGSGIFIDERGQVGIGNTRPGATLDVTGKIKTASLQIPGTNPKDSLRDLTNYVLKSKDRYGNVIWAPQSSLDDGDWSTAETGDLYFNAGNVGIGTTQTNDNKLAVAGDVKVDGTINFTGQLLHDDQPFQTSQWETNGDNIYFNEGNVGIGTTNFGSGDNTYKLAVAGAIRAEEVQIEHLDKWYDCVFEDDYALTPLKEVETFVKQNKHLPEVPSEAKVMENGISVGQMNAILLKKVEELTLHLIEQEKKIEELQKALGQQ